MTPLIHETVHGYQYRFRHLGHRYNGIPVTDPLAATAMLNAVLKKMRITRKQIVPCPVTRF